VVLKNTPNNRILLLPLSLCFSHPALLCVLHQQAKHELYNIRTLVLLRHIKVFSPALLLPSLRPPSRNLLLLRQQRQQQHMPTLSHSSHWHITYSLTTLTTFLTPSASVISSKYIPADNPCTATLLLPTFKTPSCTVPPTIFSTL